MAWFLSCLSRLDTCFLYYLQFSFKPPILRKCLSNSKPGFKDGDPVGVPDCVLVVLSRSATFVWILGSWDGTVTKSLFLRMSEKFTQS